MYSLNKSRSILQAAYDWYKKNGKSAAPQSTTNLEQRMIQLEATINSGNKAEASDLATQLETFTKENCKKGFFNYLFEILFAILIALIFAVVVRQMWFELYEIPTGSMRPNFREQDRLTVSKTPFGINIPLTTGHLLFDPNLVQRTSAVTFTSEGIPGLDEDTMFMGFIPYKKRLIKRLIGKPGDSLYFYGGKLYGIDRDGNPIEEYLTAPWMQNLEYIPFMRFSGELIPLNNKEIGIDQINQSIGKLSFKDSKDFTAEIFDGKKWVKDDPASQKTPHDTLKSYSDFYGMRNFAMARLLTKDQLKDVEGVNLKDIGDGVMYLELRHHPSLTYPKPILLKDPRHPLVLDTLKTVIPLQQEHLDALMQNMYTARLVFHDGKATRYNIDDPRFDSNSPRFPGVPDGTYEFYHGTLSKVGFQGITSQADENNPLYSHQPKNVQKLFNLGIEMHNAYQPQEKFQYYYPSRYAYFRDGDLYLLGAPILKKGDPALVQFKENEEKREKASSQDKPYIAFKDYNAPLKEGKIDKDFIRTFGITVPDKSYLVLGDNHAMSADSRVFGFVPEANLQGSPSLIIWPPGSRWGFPVQKPYPLLNLPRMIIWTIAALTALVWYILHRRYLHRRIVLNH